MTLIRRGWFHLASGAGFGRIFGFVSNLLLTRWLGPSDLGLFNLVATTVQTGDILARLGGDYALNYEIGGQPNATNTKRGVYLSQSLSQLCSLSTLSICIAITIWTLLGKGLFPSSVSGAYRLILTLALILMIACEGLSASAWEVLLASHQTAAFALRQGLFYPLRLLFAAFGALYLGVLGAMMGWNIIALFQCFWLKSQLGSLWTPFQLWPPLLSGLRRLLQRGLSFYASNFLSSLIFYPLILQVATTSGLNEIGYLRSGQILQQLFAIIPSTLVPVLFLKLRSSQDFSDQVSIIEKPLRLIWLLLIEVLLVYCLFDQPLIVNLFGSDYLPALIPTRLLLITSLFECLAQLLVQPFLATAQVRLYAFWQNASALCCAFLGWFWIPSSGLVAYLSVRLLYVIVPLIGFAIPVSHHFRRTKSLFVLLFVSMSLLIVLMFQSYYNYDLPWLQPSLIVAFVSLPLLYRHDISTVGSVLGFRR